MFYSKVEKQMPFIYLQLKNIFINELFIWKQKETHPSSIDWFISQMPVVARGGPGQNQ